MICLLALNVPGEGDTQRRVIGVVREGQRAWFKFHILRAFATQAAAILHAEEHGIEDVQF